MPRNLKERWSQFRPGPSDPSPKLGIALITLSFLRWPVTALLASPAWELPLSPWVLIPVVQACAEATFWFGVWLVGHEPLRAALARVAGKWPVRSILAWTFRAPQADASKGPSPN